MLYKFIWLLLQICITIYQSLRLSFQRLLQINSRSYDLRRDSNSFTDFSSDSESAYLSNCRAQLTKVPRHLSVLIGPNEHIEDELILRVLRYALTMNIECVSFYDTRSSEKQRIRLNSLRQPKNVISKHLGERHVLWTARIPYTVPEIPNIKHDPSYCAYSNTNGCNRKNGFKNEEKTIEIFEIKPSDGHALISDVCRKLFECRQSNEVQDLLKSRTLLSQRIDKDLAVHLWKSTDPELCIIFSKHMCTYGMLPWHTRFTEFYLHQEEDLFDAKAFAKVLFQYSRCEQRWGK